MAHLIMLMTSVQQNRLARLIFMCCSWTHFVSGESHENHCFQPALFNKIPLVKLTGASSWASYQQETILGCQAHCSKSQVCKYINVKERSDGYFDCDLLEHSKDSSGVTMTSTHGYVHYEKLCFPHALKENPCYPCQCKGVCNSCGVTCHCPLGNTQLPSIYMPLDEIVSGDKIAYYESQSQTPKYVTVVKNVEITQSTQERKNVAWFKGLGASIDFGTLDGVKACLREPHASYPSFTLTVWVKITSGTKGNIFKSGKGTLPGYYLALDGINGVIQGRAKGTGNTYGYKSTCQVDVSSHIGQWMHVSMQYTNRHYVKVFVNAQLGCTEGKSGNAGSATALEAAYIGAASKYEDQEENYDMMIDDIAFFCPVIPEDHITFIYNSTKV